MYPNSYFNFLCPYVSSWTKICCNAVSYKTDKIAVFLKIFFCSGFQILNTAVSQAQIHNSFGDRYRHMVCGCMFGRGGGCGLLTILSTSINMKTSLAKVFAINYDMPVLLRAIWQNQWKYCLITSNFNFTMNFKQSGLTTNQVSLISNEKGTAEEPSSDNKRTKNKIMGNIEQRGHNAVKK